MLPLIYNGSPIEGSIWTFAMWKMYCKWTKKLCKKGATLCKGFTVEFWRRWCSCGETSRNQILKPASRSPGKKKDWQCKAIKVSWNASHGVCATVRSLSRRCSYTRKLGPNNVYSFKVKCIYSETKDNHTPATSKHAQTPVPRDLTTNYIQNVQKIKDNGNREFQGCKEGLGRGTGSRSKQQGTVKG